MSDDDLTSLDRELRGARQAEAEPVARHVDSEADDMNKGAKAGLELVLYGLGGLGLGWAVGNWLHRPHIEPWIVAGGFAVGFIVGLYRFYKIARAESNKAGQ